MRTDTAYVQALEKVAEAARKIRLYSVAGSLAVGVHIEGHAELVRELIKLDALRAKTSEGRPAAVRRRVAQYGAGDCRTD